MAKKRGRDPLASLLDAGGWKDSHNILLFFAGSIIFGIAMGIGNSLGTILMKGSLKSLDRQTNILPPDIKSELNSGTTPTPAGMGGGRGSGDNTNFYDHPGL